MSNISGFQSRALAEMLTVENTSIEAAVQHSREAETGFTSFFRSFCDLFTGGSYSRNHDKAEAQKLAKSLIDIKGKLEYMSKEGDGKEANFTYNFGSKEASINQDVSGKLRCHFLNDASSTVLESPFTAPQLIRVIEDTIIKDVAHFGKKAASEILMSKQEDFRSLTMEDSRGRQLCLQLLESSADMKANEFQNTSTALLSIFAKNTLSADLFDAGAVRQLQAGIANASHIYSREDTELLNKLSTIKNLSTKVDIKELQPPSKKVADDQNAKWREVHNFVADLLSNEDGSLHDSNIDKPGKRLKDTLQKHPGLLVEMMRDRSLLNTLDEGLRTKLNETFDEILREREIDLIGSPNLAVFQVGAALWIKPLQDFVEMEKELDIAIQQNMTTIQEEVNKNLDMIFNEPVKANDAKADVAQNVQNQPVNKAKDAPKVEKSSELVKQEKEELEKLLQPKDSKSGYLAFMKEVFKDYFIKLSPIDQRNVLAAGIRYAKADDPEGVRLGALFKGAGPIMQKMLQGIPVTEDAPLEIKQALADMKSKLAPIDSKVVQAHLADIVESSEGNIESIKVQKSLGAASVGQAFLCSMRLKNGDTEECVIKILRPDVQNKAFREQSIFTDAAKKISGMEVTFAGALARIQEELDLTIEERNVQLGAIYDHCNGTDRVESMKLLPDTKATTNTLVIEKAPGETLSTYLQDTAKKIDDIKNDMFKKNTNEHGKVRFSSEAYIEARKELDTIYKDASKRHDDLVNLATKWVCAGIFEDGFYHGDLHAGNIMTDANKLTVIDFGNATKLDNEQQKQTMRMLAAAAVSDTKIFMKAYKSLLTQEGKNLLETKQAEIQSFVDRVIHLASGNQTGERIGALLTGLQSFGLEIPASIYNFSQCQLRLQAAMDGSIALMDKVLKAQDDIVDKCIKEDVALHTFGEHVSLVEQQANRELGNPPESNAMLVGLMNEKKEQIIERSITNMLGKLATPIMTRTVKDSQIEYFFGKSEVAKLLVQDCVNALTAGELDTYEANFEKLKAEYRAIKEKEFTDLTNYIANDMPSREENPKSFVDCMVIVINENKLATLGKLGASAKALASYA